MIDDSVVFMTCTLGFWKILEMCPVFEIDASCATSKEIIYDVLSLRDTEICLNVVC